LCPSLSDHYSLTDHYTPISSNPCQARTYHGYLGIEAEVVDYASNFISY